MEAKDKRVRAMLLGRRFVRVVPFPILPTTAEYEEHVLAHERRDAAESDEPESAEREDDEGDVVLVGVRILTEQECDAARADAVFYISELAKNRGVSAIEFTHMEGEIIDREEKRQIIYRAFLVAEDADKPRIGKEPRRFFDNAQRVRGLDTVIVSLLWSMYLEHQELVNPLQSLSDAAAQELADALSKGPNANTLLALYDLPTLRKLVRTLASLLSTALRGKSATHSSSTDNG